MSELQYKPKVMSIDSTDKPSERSVERTGWLTADIQVHVLVVLADGVAGGAEILAGIRELDVFQGERGHPCVAAYHNISIKALQRRRESNYSHLESLTFS